MTLDSVGRILLKKAQMEGKDISHGVMKSWLLIDSTYTPDVIVQREIRYDLPCVRCGRKGGDHQ